LAGKKVVFLAPTLSLVDQTATSLSKTFPASQIGQEQSDPFLAGFGGEDVAEILVLTPEACLAQMSFAICCIRQIDPKIVAQLMRCFVYSI
jgi:hypothetical protein